MTTRSYTFWFLFLAGAGVSLLVWWCLFSAAPHFEVFTAGYDMIVATVVAFPLTMVAAWLRNRLAVVDSHGAWRWLPFALNSGGLMLWVGTLVFFLVAYSDCPDGLC